MLEVVSSLCFPKSDEYLKMMADDIMKTEFIIEDSFTGQNSLTEFISYVEDISCPVSLFLRLYVLDCECPCGGLSW